jgi:hypothetical protein
MSKEVMQSIVVGNTEQKNIKNYKVSEFKLDEARSNHNAKEYVGNVSYSKDGQEVSLPFIIVEFKNKTYDFSWN